MQKDGRHNAQVVYDFEVGIDKKGRHAASLVSSRQPSAGSYEY
jgi:hypothetical protein